MIVKEIEFAGQKRYSDSCFPAVWEASESPRLSDVVAWIANSREALLQQSAQDGVVLFRGFPLHNAIDFDAFVEALGLTNFPYEQSLSNAVRVNKTPRVFTANEAPSDVTIFLHHEMAQTPIYPRRLLFFCEQAAESGGATPVCRSDALYARMQVDIPEFADACRSKGLLYRAVMPASNDPNSGMGRSWQSTFRAESQEDAEARMSELGYRWNWQPDGSLEATTPVLPAVMELDDGRCTFFNQLIAAFRGWKDSRNDPSKSIRFGDDSELPTDDVLRAAAIADELTFDLAWRNGDVAIVDNLLAMHGRRAFTGQRKVLASLTSD